MTVYVNSGQPSIPLNSERRLSSSNWFLCRSRHKTSFEPKGKKFEKSDSCKMPCTMLPEFGSPSDSKSNKKVQFLITATMCNRCKNLIKHPDMPIAGDVHQTPGAIPWDPTAWTTDTQVPGRKRPRKSLEKCRIGQKMYESDVFIKF